MADVEERIDRLDFLDACVSFVQCGREGGQVTLTNFMV